tara:strand:- start:207 stop:629 length:423 start_codon:yes stop_codon:yes gene_type:complete
MSKLKYIIILPIISIIAIIIILFLIVTSMYIIKEFNEQKLDDEAIELLEDYHSCLNEISGNNFDKINKCMNEIESQLLEYKEVIINLRGMTNEQYNIQKSWAKQAQPDFKLQLSLSCVYENSSLSVKTVSEKCNPSMMET